MQWLMKLAGLGMSYATQLLIGVIVALAVFAGVQTLRLAWEQTSHAETVAEHEKLVAASEAERTRAVEAARKEEQRRYAELQEIQDETNKALERARADGAAAVDAAIRLRGRVVELFREAGRCTRDPTLAAERSATDTSTDLFEWVQKRLDDAADGIARFADESRAAGLGCQRSYEAVRGKSP